MTYVPEEAERWETLLAADELVRARGFKHTKRRREFIMGRAAARTLLAERLGEVPERVPLRVAEDGCVEVVGSSLVLSIAHSGDHAVATVAERPIGIDLERVVPRHPGLRRFLLHPDEHDAFEELPFSEAQSCILYWTLKEATLKALGTGLRLSPKKLRADIDLERQSACIWVESRAVFHARFEERGEYYLALAFKPDAGSDGEM